MNTNTIVKELQFKATKSSGPGGQHVNKTSSKIILTFSLEKSLSLSENQKVILKEKLGHRLTKDNVLILSSEETRSQHKNKDFVIKRFLRLLKSNLAQPKKRRPTKPSRSSILKNTEKNKRNSLKKILRKKPKIN
ncbi:MAG: alternative ribosome rescue aminoacyl-tRNA hydrolase ArfB [Polaribacter sp.]|jgi:ribosome-associated protein